MEKIHAAGYDILKHCQDRGEGRKRHKHEEQRPPHASAHHMIKDIRQRDKDQARPHIRTDIKSKAGRKNDQPRNQRHKSIQHRDIHRFSQQGTALINIAAKDCHGADPQAQRKERLIHGRRNSLQNTYIPHSLHIGKQVKLQTLCSALQRNTAHRQHHNDKKKQHHHDLGDPFHPFLQTKGTDQYACPYDDHHHHRQHRRTLKHLLKQACHLLFIFAGKFSGQHLVKIIQHPSRHCRVKHHQQIIPGHADIAVQMPLLSRFLQLRKAPDHTFPAGTAHRKFHRHDRHAHNDQKQQIKQHKHAAPIHPGNIRKPPHITNSDRTPRR